MNLFILQSYDYYSRGFGDFWIHLSLVGGDQGKRIINNFTFRFRKNWKWVVWTKREKETLVARLWWNTLRSFSGWDKNCRKEIWLILRPNDWLAIFYLSLKMGPIFFATALLKENFNDCSGWLWSSLMTAFLWEKILITSYFWFWCCCSWSGYLEGDSLIFLNWSLTIFILLPCCWAMWYLLCRYQIEVAAVSPHWVTFWVRAFQF